MKQFFLSFLAALFSLNAGAQLTVANHAPVVGEQFQRYQCDSTGISPGSAGSGNLWNFSMATHSSVIHSYTTGVSNYQPPSTVSVTSNRSYEDHYKINVNSLQDYSSSFPIVSGYYINLNYTNPSLKAIYPMAIGTSSSNSISGNINAIMITPQAGTFNGTSNTTADASGTLTLAGFTYTNVLRVVTTENIAFTVSFPGTMTLKNYEFYAEGAKQPVLSIITVTLTRPAATIKRTLVTRLIHVAPSAPVDITPESDKLICENTSATLTAAGNGNIEWFDDAASTNAIGTNSVFVTDPLPIGTYTYYAQATNFLSSPRVAITVTVTDCTSLNSYDKEGTGKLYPNPGAGLFNLNLPADVNFLKVYSSDGKLLSSLQSQEGLNTVDLTKYSNGVYFIQLLHNNTLLSTKKVLVQSNER